MDLETVSGNPVINDQYLLTDSLGSVDIATDANGAVVSNSGFSFETFGERRDATTWQVPASGTAVTADRSTVTHRGFTGHEMLDNLNLVHMNGRVYDPSLGRFLSVDPVFQFPTNMQSLNPYSYVLNNPLSMTDPTGYTSACSNVSATSASSGMCSVSAGGQTTYVSYSVSDKGDVRLDTGDAQNAHNLMQSSGGPSGGTLTGGAPNMTGGELGNGAKSGQNDTDKKTGPSGEPTNSNDIHGVQTTAQPKDGNLAQPVQTTSEPSPLSAGESRHFTVGEIKLAESIFGSSIDYNQPLVNLDKAYFFQPSKTAMTPDGNMYFNPSGDLYKDDFSKADIGTQGLFLHEMVHVWQHQQGINVRKAMFNRTYFYLPLTPGKPFSDYGLEQQGDIVRDYFFLRSGYQLPYTSEQLKGIQTPTLSDYEKLLPFKH